jgi:hypothetical protein
MASAGAPLIGTLRVHVTVYDVAAIKSGQGSTISRKFGIAFALAVRNAFRHRARSLGIVPWDQNRPTIGELDVEIVLGEERA